MVAKLRNELFKRKFLFHYYNCKNKTENYISFFCQTNNLFLRIFVPLFLVLFNLKALFFSFLSFSKIVLLSADSPLTQSNRQTDRKTCYAQPEIQKEQQWIESKPKGKQKQKMKNSFLIKTDYNSKATKIGRITTTQTFRRQNERKCQKKLL